MSKINDAFNFLKPCYKIYNFREKENPPLWGMGVVATAIAVNFFGSLAQKELKVMIIDDYPDSSQTLLTFGLALLQILSAVLVFQSSSISFSGSPTNREAAILATFAHAGWLYLTSYRLWGQDTGASVSYGALEPIFCILLLCIAAGIPTELSKVGAVAAICLGTGMMTADFSILIDKTALIRIIAALFCLSQNMIIKHLYDSNVKISLRGQNTLLSVLASGTVTAVLFGLAVSSTMVVPAMIIVVSCLLSVVSLHLTFMLLSLYDNTTAVVFMLWAQVVDTVVFVSSVSRPDILLIPVGAVLFALGHYYYFKDGVESGTIHLNMKRGEYGFKVVKKNDAHFTHFSQALFT